MTDVATIHKEQMDRAIDELKSRLDNDATAYDYLIELLDANSPTEEFEDFDLSTVFTVHGNGPRQFMLVLNNPKLIPSNHTDDLHKKYARLEELNRSSDKPTSADVETLRQIATKYAADYLLEKQVFMKLLIATINSVSPTALQVDPFDQDEFSNYMSPSTDRSQESVEIGAGFFDDFHYTNRSKLHGAKSSQLDERMLDICDDWLDREIRAVDPDLIFFCGTQTHSFVSNNEEFSSIGCGDVSGNRGDLYEGYDQTIAVTTYHPSHYQDEVGDHLRKAVESAIQS